MSVHPATDPTRGDFAQESTIGTKNPFKACWIFLQQVFTELRKVVTPTGREMVTYTIAVVAFVVFMILLVFGMDFVFGSLTRALFTAH